MPIVEFSSSETESCDGEFNDWEDINSEESSQELMNSKELKISCPPKELYCNELLSHKFFEEDMRSKDYSCCESERKETLSDESLLDGLILMSENIYEVKFESWIQIEKRMKRKQRGYTKKRSDYVFPNLYLNLFGLQV